VSTEAPSVPQQLAGHSQNRQGHLDEEMGFGFPSFFQARPSREGASLLSRANCPAWRWKRGGGEQRAGTNHTGRDRLHRRAEHRGHTLLRSPANTLGCEAGTARTQQGNVTNQDHASAFRYSVVPDPQTTDYFRNWKTFLSAEIPDTCTFHPSVPI